MLSRFKECFRKIFERRTAADKIPAPTFAAIVIAVVSLALAAGVCRWSWLILDEQVRLRQDFMQLKNAQDQINVQYEFWNQQVQKERAEIQKIKAEATKK